MGFVGQLHCAGMCAPLVSTCTQKSWSYFSARLLTYILLGIGTSAIGSLVLIQLFGIHYRLLSLLFALFCLLQIIPVWNQNLNISKSFIPKILSKFFKISPLSKNVTFGIITGLLPCGLLYSALSFCFLISPPWKAGLAMGFFACATMPSLIFGIYILKWMTGKNKILTQVVLTMLFIATALLALKRGGWNQSVSQNGPPPCHQHNKK